MRPEAHKEEMGLISCYMESPAMQFELGVGVPVDMFGSMMKDAVCVCVCVRACVRVCVCVSVSVSVT
jgi:hypothetical protein